MMVWVSPQATAVFFDTVYRSSSSLLHSLSVTCVKQSALIGLLSVLAVVSSEVCLCACPVRYPVLVLSLFCRQEKEEECQPASIQLLLSYWYSGHTEPSWVSVARAKEECRKWGDGERRRRRRRGVRPLHLMLCGPKNRQHPPFFSIPRASLFPYPASLLGSPSFAFRSSLCSSSFFSLFGLSKHPLWCPVIRLLKCNPRQFGQC